MQKNEKNCKIMKKYSKNIDKNSFWCIITNIKVKKNSGG